MQHVFLNNELTITHTLLVSFVINCQFEGLDLDQSIHLPIDILCTLYIAS